MSLCLEFHGHRTEYKFLWDVWGRLPWSGASIAGSGRRVREEGDHADEVLQGHQGRHSHQVVVLPSQGPDEEY